MQGSVFYEKQAKWSSTFALSGNV